MADNELTTFVKESLQAGSSREEIERVLAEAGWSRDQVMGALNRYASVDSRIPVPRPRAYLSARDAFLYLVMFSMLYLSAYNLGSLLFQFINLGFPDPAIAEYGDATARMIRFSTSALIVAFPVFLFVAMRLARQLAADPTRRTSAVRKWLTYLTLAIAACIIVGDAIALVNSLLSGEMTVRFVLKALVAGGISGSVFVYYLREMRKDDEVLSR